jgi:predicted MFS family arabinose efflux permease
MLILGSAVFAMFYFLTIYVQKVLGFSAVKAGLAFLPVSVTIVIAAQVVSRIVTRVEPKYILASGTVFGACGLYYLSTLTPDSSYVAHVLPAIAMIAIGMGSIFVPITLAAVADVEERDTGIASAMLNVGQQIGGSLGIAALSTIAAHVSASYVMSHQVDPRTFALPVLPYPAAAAYTEGATAAFLTGAVFMVIGLIATLLLIKVRPQSPTEAAPGVAA